MVPLSGMPACTRSTLAASALTHLRQLAAFLPA